ncbi:immunity 53 family protein [Piscinibacterium candidicorallinum]|uniref:Immunity 53 family protein n=1 Tax=Piscinibacterium candidicorallinum TaxID=1793872 RepID=A0ABV7H3Q7_9BURK
MEQIARLQEWYSDQCNGGWEHTHGVKLDTLDNPGWWLVVDLGGTNLAHKPFEAVARGDSEFDADWLRCKVVSGKFEAAGGSKNLADMLEVFLSWAGY